MHIILSGFTGSVGKAIVRICQSEGILLSKFPFSREPEYQTTSNEFWANIEMAPSEQKASKTFFIHLAHPGVLANAKVYRIFRQNSIELFLRCQQSNVPLIFVSSASCFASNHSFYSRYKQDLEFFAISQGHQVMRLGIYAERSQDNLTIKKLVKFCKILHLLGFKKTLNRTDFFYFDDNELNVMICKLQTKDIPMPHEFQGSISYLAKPKALNALQLFLDLAPNVKESSSVKPKIRMDKLHFVSRTWISPKGIDAVVNFLSGHKLEGSLFNE